MENFIKNQRDAFDSAAPPQGLWEKIDDALCRESEGADLEKFIQDHRPAFDSVSPKTNLWERIIAQLPSIDQPTKTVRLWPRFALRAAAAVLLLAFGIGIGMQLNQTPQQLAEASVLTAEQQEALTVFEQNMSIKMQQAAHVVEKNPEIQADLARLDKTMEELKTELEHVPPGNRRQVIQAMLDNYKAKVHILERILEMMDKSNVESKNDNNGTTTL